MSHLTSREPESLRSVRANFPPALVLEGQVAYGRMLKNLYVVKLFEQWLLFKVRITELYIYRECKGGLHVPFS